MTAIDILQQARQAVLDGKWTTGTILDYETGESCATGLITKAATGAARYLDETETRGRLTPELFEAAQALADATGVDYSARWTHIPISDTSRIQRTLVSYNDSASISRGAITRIVEWFDRAIASLEARA